MRVPLQARKVSFSRADWLAAASWMLHRASWEGGYGMAHGSGIWKREHPVMRRAHGQRCGASMWVCVAPRSTLTVGSGWEEIGN